MAYINLGIAASQKFIVEVMKSHWVWSTNRIFQEIVSSTPSGSIFCRVHCAEIFSGRVAFFGTPQFGRAEIARAGPGGRSVKAAIAQL